MSSRHLLAVVSLAVFPGCAGVFPRVQKPAITVTAIVDHGQASYQVETPTAKWVYHREGGGFSRLLDSSDNDWLAYQPTGGAAGHYRGIPNAVFRRDQQEDNFFHPGHQGPKGSSTEIISSAADKVVLQSRSRDGRWSCEWEFRSDRARLTMTGVPPGDNGYWFLYEGTPGGRFEPTDLCLRPGGCLTPLSERWEDSTKTTPWVAFISPTRGHSLVLVAHDPPDTRVSYRPMENAMTVFGFGRALASLESFFTQPLIFTVSLVAEIDPVKLAAHAEKLSR